jgi:tripartite-type tricarboxylate transporter receptor subunit TctC
MLAPAKTPPAIVKRLQTEVAAILAQPDIQKKFEGQGAETVNLVGAEFGKHIRTETAKWTRVVKEAGIKAE